MSNVVEAFEDFQDRHAKLEARLQELEHDALLMRRLKKELRGLVRASVTVESSVQVDAARKLDISDIMRQILLEANQANPKELEPPHGG